MTSERWSALMNDDASCLTREEMADGWHWCLDWDQLLVGPGMMEMEHCTCGWNKSKHVAPRIVGIPVMEAFE